MMVEVLTSIKHPRIIFLRYTGETCTEEDDAHFHILEAFAEKHAQFYMVVGIEPGTIITDKRWFSSTNLGNSPIFRRLKKTIVFGLKGIQISFMKTYFDILHSIGIETEVLEHLRHFETEYHLSVENDFEVIFSYTHRV